MALSDIKTTWKPVQPWVEPVVAEICATRAVYFVWGKSNGTSGEHPLGRALDFSVLEYGGGVPDPGPARPALGDDIASYLWANRVRLNVWYVIWNRRIISTNPSSYAYNRWTTYRGDNPHTDHVHVSFEASGTYQPPPDGGDDDMPLTAEDLNRIRAICREEARAALKAAIVDMSSVADKYGYGNDPPLYSVAQLASDASWRTRAGNAAQDAQAKLLGDEVAGAVREALESGVVDVDIEVRDRTDA